MSKEENGTHLTLVQDIDLFEDNDKRPEIQSDFHLPDNPDQIMGINHLPTLRKVIFTPMGDAKLVATPGEEGIVRYHINSQDKYHWLKDLEIESKLPAISVKKEFENRIKICWQHNPGHNMIRSVSWSENEETRQIITSEMLDINSQALFKSKIGSRDSYRESIGAVPELEEWSTKLPEWHINFSVPFSFTRKDSEALPLWKIKDVKLRFDAVTRSNLVDLLRMKIKKKNKSKTNDSGSSNGKKGENSKGRNSKNDDDDDDDDWEIVKNMTDEFLSFLNIPDNNTKIKDPNIWGNFSNTSPGAIEDINRALIEKNLDNLIYYGESMLEVPVASVESGTEIKIPLVEERYPVKSIFILARRSKTSILSNYTTHLDNPLMGENPIESLSMIYGNDNNVRIPRRDIGHFERQVPRKYLPSCPDEKGYTCIAISSHQNSFNKAISGGIFGTSRQCQLTIRLKSVKRNDDLEKTKEIKDPMELLADEAKKESYSKQVHYDISVFMLRVTKLYY